MLFCKNCGARQRDGNCFCAECGSPLFTLTAPHAADWEALSPAMLTRNLSAYRTPEARPKNIGLAVLLTAVLGPLGLIYTSVAGALFMLVGWCFLVLATCNDWIANDVLPILIVWPVCIVWAAFTACSYNQDRR